MQQRKTFDSNGKKRRSKSTLPKIDKSKKGLQLSSEEEKQQAVNSEKFFKFVEDNNIVC